MSEVGIGITVINAGALTKNFSQNEKLIDTGSKEFADALSKEHEYVNKILTLYGPASEPKNKDATFEPATPVDDTTTLESLKPALSDILQTGTEYWKAYIKAAKFSPAGEAQLALHERALGFLNGERSDSRSYEEAVDQISMLASDYAQSQRDNRINELYARENSKSPIWLGKMVYGKAGVLWNVGASDIYHFEEAFRNHIQKVKAVSTSQIRPA